MAKNGFQIPEEEAARILREAQEHQAKTSKAPESAVPEGRPFVEMFEGDSDLGGMKIGDPEHRAKCIACTLLHTVRVEIKRRRDAGKDLIPPRAMGVAMSRLFAAYICYEAGTMDSKETHIATLGMLGTFLADTMEIINADHTPRSQEILEEIFGDPRG